MLWEQLAELCRDWMRRLSVDEARAGIAALLPAVFSNPNAVDLDELIERAGTAARLISRQQNRFYPVSPEYTWWPKR